MGPRTKPNIMNIYRKYCPNVFVAQCEEEHKKGDTIMIDPRTEAVVTDIEGISHLLIQEFQVLGVL